MTAASEPVILKTDRLGRVRTPVAQREALLDAFERSGLSGMKFAALHGVKYPSFANWVQGRKRRRQPDRSGTGVLSDEAEGASLAAVAGGSAGLWWEAVMDSAPPPAVATPGGTMTGGFGGLQMHLPGGLQLEIHAPYQTGWAAQLLAALAPGTPSPSAPPLC